LGDYLRKLAAITGGFSLGIVLAQYLLPETWVLLAAVLATLLVAASFLLPSAWRRRGVLIFSAMALAFGYNWLYCRIFQQPMKTLADTEASITMTLCDYATATDYGAKAEVRIEGMPAKAIYYGDHTLLELEPGQRVEDLVLFQRADNIRGNEITSFTSKRIFLLAYSRGELTVSDEISPLSRGIPVRAGRFVQEKIFSYFEGDTAAFLCALLTGDRTELSKQAANDFSESGLSHIMAVSGMHCGFLLSILMLLIGKHRHKLIILIAIPVLLFYALLTGGSPSVIRACIMLSMMLIATLAHRENDGITSLLVALSFILVQNPFAAASVSLQLSFASTAGLLWLTPKLYKRMLHVNKGNGKLKAIVASSVASTAGAMIFSVPVAAYYFGILSLVSPLSNLLCLWAVSIVFVLGLLAVLFALCLHPVVYFISFPTNVLIHYILYTAHALAAIPYHAVYFVNSYLKLWLAFAYGIFIIVYFKKRGYGLAIASIIISLTAAIYIGAAKYDGDFEAIVMDAGQGQCVVLASDGEFSLIDCGSGNSWYDTGNNAADLLITMGCRKLDMLVLTHYDSDHVNGVADVLTRLEVDTLYMPTESDAEGLQSDIERLAEQHGTKACYVDNRMLAASLGSAELRLLPSEGNSSEDNEQGLAVQAVFDNKSVLLTGDMNRASEKRLLDTYDFLAANVLIAGHHGAKGSTSSELLEELAPETVCISVGSNSYGHPAKETLRRLAEQGCTVYRTDLHGNIRLSWNEGE